jgi:NADH-quinone oxidoreductase subunit C/D
MNLIKEVDNLLHQHVVTWESGRGYVQAQLDELDTILLCCKENLGFHWISDIIGKEIDENNYGLQYLLKNPESKNSLMVTCEFSKTVTVKSIAHLWRHAAEFEKEVHEMFGIKFDFEIPRYLFSENFVGHPLLKDFDKFVIGEPIKRKQDAQIVLKPKFPLNEQDIKINLNLDNDKVSTCNLEMGFHHFGFEKSSEGKNVDQILNSIGVLSAKTSAMWTMNWAHLVEKGLDISIPDKAMGVRMILNELTRVQDHLYTLILISYQCGYEDFVSSLTIWYRKTLEQITLLTKNQNSSLFIIVGGVRSDIPTGWISNCLEFLTLLEKELLTEYKFLTKSSFWYERLQCGTIKRETAMEWGITGPALRACGVNYDLRKRDPIYFYKDISFDIPLGINGHIYDRFLVLVEEIFQSLKIISQVLENIPTGKVISEDVNSFYHIKKNEEFDEAKYKSSIYSKYNINFSNSWSEWESSGGVAHINATFDKDVLTRLKVTSPGQKLMGLFTQEIINERLEDAELFWLSLGIKMSEVEK